MRWMKLEPIIQSEVSQKEKQQYSILMHIYGIWKDGNDTLYARQQKRHRCIEQSFGLCGRGWDDLGEWHWMLSFKPTFSLSSFIFIKRVFSSSSLSAIRVVSSAYLRLLIFPPGIFIPAYASSNPAFCVMHSVYKLNKHGDNIQPLYCFPNLEPVCCCMSSSNWCFLTCIQISQEAGQKAIQEILPISWRIFHSLLWCPQSKSLV